jgi:8-amino-7-oxononanoate synthase|tara:strand:+ start:16090 stop:17244 length:1155 start_codon:yes stop_codon:yes gene_type:complete
MDINLEIKKRKDSGLFRKRRIVTSPQGAQIDIKGKSFLNFSSNDYLGLANNNKLKLHMVESIKKYGVGSGSSQLMTGHMRPHQLLEKRLSIFFKKEASLIFSSGYHANLAIASTLINKNTVIIQDKLNHASLIDSALLSEGKLVRYRHKDFFHLQKILEKYKKQDLIVMTDGVFSMDGDRAPLREISKICHKYNALLIVDDAHGVGVLGKRGAGLMEELNLEGEIDLLIGTFGKSIGASGAFIAGNENLIEAFIQKARTYIYTTAMLPALANTIVHAIDLIENSNNLRTHICDLVEHYKKLSKKLELYLSDSNNHIQPIIIGGANETVRVSEALYEKNILVSAIRPPTVPKDTSRLRISITASHTKKDITLLLNTIKNIQSGDC